MNKECGANVEKVFIDEFVPSNAKLSEALNITKATEKYTGIDLSVIKQALIKAQEQEKENTEYKKVLEIIKEKDVDIGLLKRSEYWLEYYTGIKHRTGINTELTEEEFELLKRYFE